MSLFWIEVNKLILSFRNDILSFVVNLPKCLVFRFTSWTRHWVPSGFFLKMRIVVSFFWADSVSPVHLYFSAMTLKNKEYEKQMQDNIQGRALLQVFIRMNSKRKLELMTNLVQLVRNLRILADILNIFFSVNTKLLSYSKIAWVNKLR